MNNDESWQQSTRNHGRTASHPYATSVPISMPTWRREKHSFEEEEEDTETDKRVSGK